jgi:PIN domain nuclease of toxin-antitoxin system
MSTTSTQCSILFRSSWFQQTRTSRGWPANCGDRLQTPGDRFCLALAKQKNLPAWTADKGWKRIAAAAGVEVVTIR